MILWVTSDTSEIRLNNPTSKRKSNSPSHHINCLMSVITKYMCNDRHLVQLQHHQTPDFPKNDGISNKQSAAKELRIHWSPVNHVCFF